MAGSTATLYEGTTDQEELHVVFSRLAQNVDIAVVGGRLLSAEIYGRAADLVMSEGEKTVTIRGIPLNESSVVKEYPVAREGETDVEQNPLITTDAMADALADHVTQYLTMRNTYDINYRGNPELTAGDIIGIQTPYSSHMDALVLIDKCTFNGAFGGSARVKGLI